MKPCHRGISLPVWRGAAGVRALAWIVCGWALACALPLRAGTDLDAYFAATLALCDRHGAQWNRVQATAEETANSLAKGARFFLAGDPAWTAEGFGRAGGMQLVQRLQGADQAAAGDVVWLAYTRASYGAWRPLIAALRERGVHLACFGPSAPEGMRAGEHWVDSLMAGSTDPNFTLLGNMLSFWTTTAETTGSLARKGKTPVFLLSHSVRGWQEREALYRGRAFHDGLPAMQSVEAGKLSREYLAQVRAAIASIQQRDAGSIGRLGAEIAARAKQGRPVLLATLGHMSMFAVSATSPLYRFFGLPKERPALEQALQPGERIVFLGYLSVPPDLWHAVHAAKATAAWIVAPLPLDVDAAQFGDTLIDQQWKIGDATVQVPGYDISVFPPSGVTQLVIFEGLMRTATAASR